MLRPPKTKDRPKLKTFIMFIGRPKLHTITVLFQKQEDLKPVLRDHCHGRPPVLKDHTF